MRDELRAQGDRDLAERLKAETEIRQAIERYERHAKDSAARLQLLGSSIRLTPAMAPDIDEILNGCRETLGIESPLETFVYPSASFNAAAVKSEQGRLLVIVSSSLLEAFEPDELRFVAGHELAHHMFEHHSIPVGALLGGGVRIAPGLVLQLFAWQRFAEISSDRAGVVCAGGLQPAASGLFKLASGLRGGRVKVRIDQFLAQVSDLREEAGKLDRGGKSDRTDWFSTHPFSPLRLKAAELFTRSELMLPGGTPLRQLEAQVQDLMTVMRPSYLEEKSDVAEAMRRLLFAGGVAIAAVSGEVKEEEIQALEKLLGPGSLPFEVKPDLIRKDLPNRIAAVNKNVPPLRRAQIVRDLCVIARADGCADEAEVAVIHEIASAIGVEAEQVECLTAPPEECA